MLAARREHAAKPRGDPPGWAGSGWRRAQARHRMRHCKKPNGATAGEAGRRLGGSGICRSGRRERTFRTTTAAQPRPQRRAPQRIRLSPLGDPQEDGNVRPRTAGAAHLPNEILAGRAGPDPGSPLDCRARRGRAGRGGGRGRRVRGKGALPHPSDHRQGVKAGRQARAGPIRPPHSRGQVPRGRGAARRKRPADGKKGRASRCGQSPGALPGPDPDVRPGRGFGGFAGGMPDADASGYADRRASKAGCRVPGERTRGAAQAAGCLRVAAILRNLAVIANLWLPAAS